MLSGWRINRFPPLYSNLDQSYLDLSKEQQMSMHLQELIGLKAIHSIEHEDVMVKLLALSLRDKAAMWPSSGWAFSPYGNRVGKEIFQMPYYSKGPHRP